MRKNWERTSPVAFELTIDNELIQILRLCAQVVRDDIRKNVRGRLALNGSPQRPNKMSTILRKGHDHQLYEKRGTFFKEDTYRISVNARYALIEFIYPAQDGGNVGVYVTAKGYEFWGISPKAESKIGRLLDGWFRKTLEPLIWDHIKSGGYQNIRG